MAHILVIEDDATLRQTLEGRLTEEGYTVHSAATTDNGLAILKEANIDLILLDLRLNGHSGLDLLKELQTSPALKEKHSKVIVLTSIEHPGMVLQTIGYGLAAEDYLSKGKVSLDEIVAHVKAKLESSQ